MPGTHLLPPNLLKLFAPRPPLPYTRPVDRDIDRVRSKSVGGVADILANIREETTNNLFTANASSEAMEEGEEPVFTLAEEAKRQLRREQRKARLEEEFKKAKENCLSRFPPRILHDSSSVQTHLPTMQKLSVTPTKHSSFPASYVPLPLLAIPSTHPFNSTRAPPKRTSGANSRATAPSNVYA
jgi:hypothetical protein